MNTRTDSNSTLFPQKMPRRKVVLRVLVGGLLVVGMGSGWWMMGQQKAARQAAAVEAVRTHGGEVYMVYQWSQGKVRPDAEPPQPEWFRNLVGPAMLDHPAAVDLADARDVEECIAQLSLMPDVRALAAPVATVDDQDLSSICRLKGLTHLDLSGTSISDSGVSELAGLERLQVLSLANTEVTDQAVGSLKQLEQLRKLDVSGSRLTAAGRERLTKELPRCEIVGP